MYQSYFGLAEAPFSIAPDPRYLYLSQRHEEALAHLLYGVGGEGGFVLLTGEVGAGKTTVCRCLLEQVPESCDVAYIFNPKLTVEELLSTICVEFGIAYPAGNTSVKVFVDCLNAYLLDANARGRHTVLIIDEAQNLSADVLEQMRLLTNLETNQRKLLQIILLGQPELLAMLERAELRQLAQRIVAHYHLGPLSKSEVAAYVRHRLEVSGTQRELFPARLMGRLYRMSGGIPRVINVLCDRALLGAYVQGKERVDGKTLAQADRVAGGALAVAFYGQEWISAVTVRVTAAPGTPPAAPVRPEKKADADKSALDLPETLEWPADQPRSRGKAIAYAALFRQWNADYQGGDACREAERLGLRCRVARGGLDELRQLNRPAVLQMRDEQGAEFFAALSALDDKSATFAFGPEVKVTSLGALAAQWSGRYTLLWRLPREVHENIRQGERGAAVAWLNRQLAQVQGREAHAGDEALFDDVLLRQVKAFQLAQGLVPDGAAGPQTLMRLAGAADRDAPKLLRGEK
ncbi:MAG: AAA family ATPase [Betaproteobacteria bacterium]|nr:AAA family ATPase [Betaproteobacteria bacterium]